jgi:hypothetical protein
MQYKVVKNPALLCFVSTWVVLCIDVMYDVF